MRLYTTFIAINYAFIVLQIPNKLRRIQHTTNNVKLCKTLLVDIKTNKSMMNLYVPYVTSKIYCVSDKQIPAFLL